LLDASGHGHHPFSVDLFLRQLSAQPAEQGQQIGQFQEGELGGQLRVLRTLLVEKIDQFVLISVMLKRKITPFREAAPEIAQK
jgi:hypothetical protein